MPRQPMPDALKPKHVLSFRATDSQRAYLEKKYGKASVGLTRLVAEAMRKDAAAKDE